MKATMKEFLKKINSFYNDHPLFQVISFFLMISFVIYIAYTMSTMGYDNNKYLKIDDKKIKTTPKVIKKVEQKSSVKKTVVLVASPTKIKAKEKAKEKAPENNIQTIQKLRSKRFDSDIKDAFNFDNNF